MNYYYNLDQTQAQHFASLETGEKMVIVIPLPKQPEEDTHREINPKQIGLNSATNPDFEPPYPLNARVGLRETWSRSQNPVLEGAYLYKADNLPYPHRIAWRSAQCMPRKAIRYWGVVEDARVDRVQDIQSTVMHKAGFVTCRDFDNWFNCRYKGGWEQNPYCEIMMIKKEK